MRGAHDKVHVRQRPVHHGAAHVAVLGQNKHRGNVAIHRLDIDGIQVVKNDTTIVAKDIHHGFTGGQAKDNQYRIVIDQYETGASFKIKAAVYGDIGNDTNGRVFIKRTP